MKNRNEKIFLYALFFGALFLRLGYMFFLREHYFFYDHPSSDVDYYLAWSHSIGRTNFIGNKVFYGLPLYPYFLAILDGLTLGNLFLVHFIHLVLGSLNCVLGYFVAKKIFPVHIARISSVLMATNFILIYYDWLMMPVTLLITLSFLIILGLLQLSAESRKRDWLFLGLLIGLTILGDGKFLIFWALLSVYFLLGHAKKLDRPLVKKVLPLSLGVFLVLFSITLRNKIIGGDFVFISAQSGLSLFVGNNPTATGIFKNPEFIRPSHAGQDTDQQAVAETITGKKMRPSEVSRFWAQRAFEFIRHHPEQYLRLLRKKVIAFLTDHEEAYDIDLLLQKKWKDQLDINPLRLIWPLAILGLLLAARNQKGYLPINFLVFSQLCITLVFFLTNRHRATILPFLIIYEVYAISCFWEFTKSREWRNLIIYTLAFAAMFSLFQPKKIDPRVIKVLELSNSGPIYVERGMFPEAEKSYTEALKMRPLDVSTINNLGTLYALQEKYDKAITQFKKALVLQPINPDTHHNLAYCYNAIGDFPSAIFHYNVTLQIQPDSINTLFQLGEVYRTIGNCKTAEAYYKKVLSFKPHLADEIIPLLKQCLQENPPLSRSIQ